MGKGRTDISLAIYAPGVFRGAQSVTRIHTKEKKKKKKKKKKRINHAETKTKSDWPGESQMSKFQLIKTLFCCSLVLHLQFFSKKSDVASQVGDAADIRCARFERA